MKFFRRGWVIAVAAVLLLAAAGAIIDYYFRPFEARREGYRQKPEAPPDLAKLQPKFSAALDALRRGAHHRGEESGDAAGRRRDGRHPLLDVAAVDRADHRAHGIETAGAGGQPLSRRLFA